MQTTKTNTTTPTTCRARERGEPPPHSSTSSLLYLLPPCIPTSEASITANLRDNHQKTSNGGRLLRRRIPFNPDPHVPRVSWSRDHTSFSGLQSRPLLRLCSYRTPTLPVGDCPPLSSAHRMSGRRSHDLNPDTSLCGTYFL